MEISDDKVKQSCRLSKGSECCAFLMMSPSGWICGKDEPTLRSSIEKRLEEGTMNAKGEGDWNTCLFSKID